jgi:hypothetical protein
LPSHQVDAWGTGAGCTLVDDVVKVLASLPILAAVQHPCWDVVVMRILDHLLGSQVSSPGTALASFHNDKKAATGTTHPPPIKSPDTAVRRKITRGAYCAMQRSRTQRGRTCTSRSISSGESDPARLDASMPARVITACPKRRPTPLTIVSAYKTYPALERLRS